MSETKSTAAPTKRTTKSRSTASKSGTEVFEDVAAPDKTQGNSTSPKQGGGLERIREIPVLISVELGRRTMSVSELLDLGQGSVVELDALAGEPVNLLVNNHPVANGDIVTVDDKYGIRITEILTSSERIQKLRT